MHPRVDSTKYLDSGMTRAMLEPDRDLVRAPAGACQPKVAAAQAS